MLLLVGGLNRTVLVIEDDPDVRNALAELLSGEGYQVSATADGAEALDTLRGGLLPSVIVLDLMMPNMDGWDFRRAQLEDPTLAPVPVVLLTASGFRPDVVHESNGISVALSLIPALGVVTLFPECVRNQEAEGVAFRELEGRGAAVTCGFLRRVGERSVVAERFLRLWRATAETPTEKQSIRKIIS